MNDNDLIEMYFQRNERAVAITSDIYGGRLNCLAQNMLLSKEDASECVNDTYMKVWNAIPPERPQNFLAFIARICRNTCLNRIDYLNAGKRKAQIVELTRELENCIASPDDNDSGDSAIANVISEYLHSISQSRRVIFVRRYWYSDSISDISARMNMKESAVKVTLHRTRKELKAFLEKRGYGL